MSNPYAFTEFFKNSFDLNQWFATQRRNLEALSAANQALVDGAQAIGRRQAEAMRENVEKTLQASREVFSGGTPDVSLTKQTALAKEMFQSAIENAREAADTWAKASFEAFDQINERTTQSLDELSKATGSAQAKKKTSAAA